MSYMEMKEATQTAENIAKETQEAMQAIIEWSNLESQEDETMLPEDYRHTIFDAISSLCEDICQSPDALDNLNRGKAIHRLAESYKILASIQTVADFGPLQLMQGLKDYCAGCEDCTQCELDIETCKRLLCEDTPPEEWELPGRVEDGKTEG